LQIRDCQHQKQLSTIYADFADKYVDRQLEAYTQANRLDFESA
jgi:hypothetical protein